MHWYSEGKSFFLQWNAVQYQAPRNSNVINTKLLNSFILRTISYPRGFCSCIYTGVYIYILLHKYVHYFFLHLLVAYHPYLTMREFLLLLFVLRFRLDSEVKCEHEEAFVGTHPQSVGQVPFIIFLFFLFFLGGCLYILDIKKKWNNIKNKSPLLRLYWCCCGKHIRKNRLHSFFFAI